MYIFNIDKELFGKKNRYTRCGRVKRVGYICVWIYIYMSSWNNIIMISQLLFPPNVPHIDDESRSQRCGIDMRMKITVETCFCGRFAKFETYYLQNTSYRHPLCRPKSSHIHTLQKPPLFPSFLSYHHTFPDKLLCVRQKSKMIASTFHIYGKILTHPE